MNGRTFNVVLKQNLQFPKVFKGDNLFTVTNLLHFNCKVMCNHFLFVPVLLDIIFKALMKILIGYSMFMV